MLPFFFFYYISSEGLNLENLELMYTNRNATWIRPNLIPDSSSRTKVNLVWTHLGCLVLFYWPCISIFLKQKICFNKVVFKIYFLKYVSKNLFLYIYKKKIFCLFQKYMFQINEFLKQKKGAKINNTTQP